MEVGNGGGGISVFFFWFAADTEAERARALAELAAVVFVRLICLGRGMMMV